MRFDCPGGCGKRYDIADGHLVMERGPWRRKRGDVGRYPHRDDAPAIVILCEPCTVSLILARASA